jgi:hypothetical protein
MNIEWVDRQKEKAPFRGEVENEKTYGRGTAITPAYRLPARFEAQNVRCPERLRGAKYAVADGGMCPAPDFRQVCRRLL